MASDARSPGAAARDRVRSLYDLWSKDFVEAAGTTFQSGLVKASEADPEDPDRSTLLVAEAAGLRDGDRILDAGCGVGGPAVAMLRAHPACTLVGITLSPVQAEMARDLADRSGVGTRARFLVGDYHEVPEPDGSFDRIFFFECTGYSEDPVALYAEAHRLLAPGGVVCVKDVFRRAAQLPADEEERMRAFDDLWACVRSPALSKSEAAARSAGFRVRVRAYPHVGTFRFLGSMFTATGQMNEFGKAFARTFAPIVFGELIGEKTA